MIISLLSILTTLVAAKEYREYNERSAAQMAERKQEYWDWRSEKTDSIIFKHSHMVWKACKEINKTASGNKWCGRGMLNKPESIKEILADEISALAQFNTDNPIPELMAQQAARKQLKIEFT